MIERLNRTSTLFMSLAKRSPAVSYRRTGGVSSAWWFVRWLLVLVLAFDHLSAPFHPHHHEGVEGQFEVGATHTSFDHANTHADSDEHPLLSHSATALRIDPSRLGQVPAVVGADVPVAFISVVDLLGSLDEPPPTRWRPDRSPPDFRSHRSLPPAGRAPPFHA